jgi:pimeloyl-ACP methyl ester carboxylesterase
MLSKSSWRSMKNLRRYGEEPFTVAVLHGGPGAPGGMAPVAGELSKDCGVLEPLQTADTIAGQVQELKTVIEGYGSPPLVLIGHSWGAWLGYIFSAHYPSLVKRLVLVGSGPYEEEYVSIMNETRRNRFTEEEKARIKDLTEMMNGPAVSDEKGLFAEFGRIMSRVDSFRPIADQQEAMEFQPEIFHRIMQEVTELRRSGGLKEFGRNITCPVLAIHGDYDGHPAQGVELPLSEVIADFRFVLLRDCGHNPWNEFYAKDEFYRVLKAEIMKDI